MSLGSASDFINVTDGVKKNWNNGRMDYFRFLSYLEPKARIISLKMTEAVIEEIWVGS